MMRAVTIPSKQIDLVEGLTTHCTLFLILSYKFTLCCSFMFFYLNFMVELLKGELFHDYFSQNKGFILWFHLFAIFLLVIKHYK